jgi:hypothetical protein
VTASLLASGNTPADRAHDERTRGPASLSTEDLVRAYLAAEAAQPITPLRFVHEAAWVILCTGMSEAVVSRVFPRLLEQLSDLSPEWLAAHPSTARKRALGIFGHEQKIDSILQIAERARVLGADGLRHRMDDPEPFLRALPYIGPVTWRHLAKNLGAPVAKADRHLTRFAKAAGRPSVDNLCAEISSWMGDPVPVVDLVLWRWSILHARSCDGGCSRLPLCAGH